MDEKLILGSLETDLVPGNVEYAILLPPDYTEADKPLPLLLNMHGGGLDRNYLSEPEVRSLYEKLWAEGVLPPMVIACYSARGSVHLNYRDGSERWEDFVFEFMAFMRKTYNTDSRRSHNYLFGISMGALGSLRLMFKYPDHFGAVAALEGVLNPVLDFADLQPRNYGMLMNFPPQEQAKRWGWPVDRDYYHANNQANIAGDNAETIREFGPKIYLECGDHDFYNAHDGNEFLHRVLWENRIEHEYRLLHDCDHVGSSLLWRMKDAHCWLGNMARKLMCPEDVVLPEPTPEQTAYFKGVVSGAITRLPTEEEKLGLFEDTAIPLNRLHMPDYITKYCNQPLAGVFRGNDTVSE